MSHNPLEDETAGVVRAVVPQGTETAHMVRGNKREKVGMLGGGHHHPECELVLGQIAGEPQAHRAISFVRDRIMLLGETVVRQSNHQGLLGREAGKRPALRDPSSRNEDIEREGGDPLLGEQNGGGVEGSGVDGGRRGIGISGVNRLDGAIIVGRRCSGSRG